jgi:hypothetical protein
MTRLPLGLFLGMALCVGATAGEKKPDTKKPKKKSGTVTGTLVAKHPNAIEVKADGEEKARRYVPRWVGGLPARGGGLDKKMVAIIKGLKVGSRLRIEWEFDERPRVVKIEVLKLPKEKKDR